MRTSPESTPALLGNRAALTIEIPDMPGRPRVVALAGEEAISTPFEFRVELAGDEVELDALVGRPASLLLEGLAAPRHLHGEIARVDHLGDTPRAILYEVTIVPPIWRLGLGLGARIFQQRSTPEILGEVLRAAGIKAEALRFDLRATYAPRGYCVQYGESDLAFLSRLMEEDGIFYFFAHSPERTTLVIADHPGAHPPIAGAPTIPFGLGGEVRVEEQITGVRCSQRLRPGKVTLRDHNLHEPDLELEVSARGRRDDDLERYEYPGEYQDPGAEGPHQGAAIAQIRLECIDAGRQEMSGESESVRLVPGHTFALTGHRLGALDRRHLLTRVVHRASQPQALDEYAEGAFRYTCAFTAIDAATPFRPPRVTPRPFVRGVQTATVVGAGSEEVYTDEHGRVLVQFHWDREGTLDEGSSCWVRVSQAWAGAGFGAVFLPRVGHEVLVDFIEGDPDRPIITGRVYHGRSEPPYALPDEKTRSVLRSESSPGGGGYNELSFEDAKGREELFLRAQRDRRELTLHDHRASVGHDQALTIAGAQTIAVTGDRRITVREGDHSLTVDRGGSEITIEGDRRITVRSGASALTVDRGSHTLAVEQAITATSRRANLGFTARTSIAIECETAGLRASAEQDVTITSRSAALALEAPRSAALTATAGPLDLRGHGPVTVDSGAASLGLTSQGRATLSSRSDAVDLVAPTGVHVDGGAEVTIAATAITVKAVASLTLSVGASTIELTPAGITISGPSLKSCAIGIHEISGALVKIN